MWPDASETESRGRPTHSEASLLRSSSEVVVVGRTGGPKNKVLRAIVTRMRRAVGLQRLKVPAF